MKKLLAVLLTLLLIFPAVAEEESALYLLTKADGTPVGTAALCLDATTLVAAAHLAGQGELLAVGAGGTFAMTAMGSLDGNLALFTLETPAPATPMALSLTSTPALAWGHDESGQACTSTLGMASVMPYGEDYAMTYTAQQAMLPGSVLVDESGSLCGVTLAAYGEGINRYVAVAGQSLAAIQYNAAWLTGFATTVEAGAVTVDWSGCDLACGQEDCVVAVFVQDTANPYFMYYAPEEGTQATLPLTPGRSYGLWVQHAHGEPQPRMGFTEACMVAVTLPQAEAFTLYDYATSAMHLSSVPQTEAAAAANTYQPPMEAITMDALTAEDCCIFLQVCSTYAVTEEESATLVASLVTPEGYCFTLEGQFLFEPELQQQDDWNMDITELLADCLAYGGQLSPGEYTLSFYLDGALGGTMTFTLEE